MHVESTSELTDSAIAKYVAGGYPLKLELRYQIGSGSSRRGLIVGMGQTLVMSSRRVAFTVGQPIGVGRKVEISVSWPVLLEKRVKLQLLLKGSIVWSEGTIAIVDVAKHEFRTRASSRPEVPKALDHASALPDLSGFVREGPPDAQPLYAE